MTTTTVAHTSTSSTGRRVQLGLAALLGFFIVGFTGLSQVEAVHNAAHDYRHSLGFPCH